MNYLIAFSFLSTLWHCVDTTKSAAYCPEIVTKELIEPTGIRKHRVTTERVTLYIPLTSIINLYKIEKKKIKYEVVNKCCVGYSMNEQGICEPLCGNKKCGEFEECIERDKCVCKSGYTTAMNVKNSTCLPICDSGCGQNEHCQAPNQCACDEGYISSPSESAVDVGKRCRRRCRAGADWDPLTLICVERRVVNVTVITAELDLLMADFKADQLNDIDGVAVAELEAFLNDKNSTATTSATAKPNSKTSSSLNVIHASIGFGVTIVLLTFAAILFYILKRRKQSTCDVILEEKDGFVTGECFLDRSQILVY